MSNKTLRQLITALILFVLLAGIVALDVYQNPGTFPPNISQLPADIRDYLRAGIAVTLISIVAATLRAVLELIVNLIVSEPVADLVFRLTQHILNRPSITTEVRQPLPSGIVPQDIGELESLAPPAGAELIVISSGKGGVGKSLLSLGMAEHLSRRGRTLLVDFDLQNRGLTSLLNKGEADDGPSVFGLLDEFRKMLAAEATDKAEVFPDVLKATMRLPDGFERGHFNTLINKYASARYEKVWHDIQQYPPLNIELKHYSKDLSDKTIDSDFVSLHPRKAFFLPSRLKPKHLDLANTELNEDAETFLFSEVSTSSFIAVYLFLRSLSWWLQGKVEHILLDCHGAHDMFTVASVLAAQKLIVVTTTDPGSWDGTSELLDTIDKINRKFSLKKEVVLVWNNLDPFEKTKSLRMFGELAIPPREVKIRTDNKIRNLMKTYKFGEISKHVHLWKAIGEIIPLTGRAKSALPPSVPNGSWQRLRSLVERSQTNEAHPLPSSKNTSEETDQSPSSATDSTESSNLDSEK